MGWRGGGVEPSVCAGAHLPGREAAGGSKARRRENIGLARHDPAALSSVRAAVRVRDLRRAKRSPQTGQPRQRESGGRPRAHPSRFLRASVSAAPYRAGGAAAAVVARVCLHGRDSELSRAHIPHIPQSSPTAPPAMPASRPPTSSCSPLAPPQ